MIQPILGVTSVQTSSYTKLYKAVFFTSEVPKVDKTGQRFVSSHLGEAQRRQRDGHIRFAPEPGKAYIHGASPRRSSIMSTLD